MRCRCAGLRGRRDAGQGRSFLCDGEMREDGAWARDTGQQAQMMGGCWRVVAGEAGGLVGRDRPDAGIALFGRTKGSSEEHRVIRRVAVIGYMERGGFVLVGFSFVLYVETREMKMSLAARIAQGSRLTRRTKRLEALLPGMARRPAWATIAGFVGDAQTRNSRAMGMPRAFAGSASDCFARKEIGRGLD